MATAIIQRLRCAWISFYFQITHISLHFSCPLMDWKKLWGFTSFDPHCTGLSQVSVSLSIEEEFLVERTFVFYILAQRSPLRSSLFSPTWPLSVVSRSHLWVQQSAVTVPKRTWDIWEAVNGLIALVTAILSSTLYCIVFLEICPGNSKTFLLEPRETLFGPLLPDLLHGYLFLLVAPLNSQSLLQA